MPFISHTEYQMPVYFVHHAKCQDIASQDLPNGNRIKNFSSKDSKISEKKVRFLSIQKSSNIPNHSKPKIRILTGKSVSGKLFSRAKIISDSKRQTFLFQSPSHLDRTSSNKSETKKIRFLRVSKPSVTKELIPKKPKSVDVQNHIISEYYIQPENNYSHANKKNSKLSLKKNKIEEVFRVDYEDAKLIKKKNMFTSSTGQLLLKQLVCGNLSPIETKSNKTIVTNQNLNLKNDYEKNFCLKIPKVISVEMHDRIEISKIAPKNQGDTSFFNEVKDDKVEGYISSFSRLIMKDKLMSLKSDELNLSKTIQDSEFGELSLMSKQ